MTETKNIKAALAEREALIDRIFGRSLDLTVERLENVDPKEKRDSMAFDRVARTAQCFVRVAHEAQALAVQNRKDHAAHDTGGEVRLPDDDDIALLESILDQRVARSRGDRERDGADEDEGRSGADPRAASGGVA